LEHYSRCKKKIRKVNHRIDCKNREKSPKKREENSEMAIKKANVQGSLFGSNNNYLKTNLRISISYYR